jgi:hypothetical protein
MTLLSASSPQTYIYFIARVKNRRRQRDPSLRFVTRDDFVDRRKLDLVDTAAKRSLSPGDLAGCSFFYDHSTEEAACSGQLPGIPFYRGVATVAIIHPASFPPTAKQPSSK